MIAAKLQAARAAALLKRQNSSSSSAASSSTAAKSTADESFSSSSDAIAGRPATMNNTKLSQHTSSLKPVTLNSISRRSVARVGRVSMPAAKVKSSETIVQPSRTRHASTGGQPPAAPGGTNASPRSNYRVGHGLNAWMDPRIGTLLTSRAVRVVAAQAELVTLPLSAPPSYGCVVLAAQPTESGLERGWMIPRAWAESSSPVMAAMVTGGAAGFYVEARSKVVRLTTIPLPVLAHIITWMILKQTSGTEKWFPNESWAAVLLTSALFLAMDDLVLATASWIGVNLEALPSLGDFPAEAIEAIIPHVLLDDYPHLALLLRARPDLGSPISLLKAHVQGALAEALALPTVTHGKATLESALDQWSKYGPALTSKSAKRLLDAIRIASITDSSNAAALIPLIPSPAPHKDPAVAAQVASRLSKNRALMNLQARFANNDGEDHDNAADPTLTATMFGSDAADPWITWDKLPQALFQPFMQASSIQGSVQHVGLDLRGHIGSDLDQAVTLLLSWPNTTIESLDLSYNSSFTPQDVQVLVQSMTSPCNSHSADSKGKELTPRTKRKSKDTGVAQLQSGDAPLLFGALPTAAPLKSGMEDRAHSPSTFRAPALSESPPIPSKGVRHSGAKLFRRVMARTRVSEPRRARSPTRLQPSISSSPDTRFWKSSSLGGARLPPLNGHLKSSLSDPLRQKSGSSGTDAPVPSDVPPFESLLLSPPHSHSTNPSVGNWVDCDSPQDTDRDHDEHEDAGSRPNSDPVVDSLASELTTKIVLDTPAPPGERVFVRIAQDALFSYPKLLSTIQESSAGSSSLYSVTHLNLSGNVLRGTGAVTLANSLPRLPTLRELLLARCAINSSGIIALCNVAQSGRARVSALDLSGNCRGRNDMEQGEAVARALSTLIWRPTPVKELRIDDIPLKGVDLLKLLTPHDGTAVPPQLIGLGLARVARDDSTNGELANALTALVYNGGLHWVDVSGNELSSAPVAPSQKAEALRQIEAFGSSLRSVDVGRTRLAGLLMTQSPGYMFADWLNFTPNLQVLNLDGLNSSNELPWAAGLALLFRRVGQARGLRVLSLAHNRLGDGGGQMIVAAAKQGLFNHLTVFGLRGNGFSVEMLQTLRSLFDSVSIMESGLDCESVHVGHGQSQSKSESEAHRYVLGHVYAVIDSALECMGVSGALGRQKKIHLDL